MSGRTLAVTTLVVLGALSVVKSADGPKQLIAHRGASGYAPEHTMAAYRLAIEQGADFVEQDLGVTKDGVLVCLHDDTLERTTNVEEVFPDRFTMNARGDRKQWVIADFTLAELKRLDSGSWFDPKFAGEKILTWQEAIDFVRGKKGMYPELKSPPLYTARGIDMTKLFVDSVKKNGMDTAESLRRTPVIIQSFDEPTVLRASKELPTIPRVFLTSNEADVTEERLQALAKFASGIAPTKSVIERHPDMVARAHALGLTVTSWTFAANNSGSYPNVRAEMAQFLYTWGIDALFTNNPDQFPRTAPSR